jgi:hypothetical protein
MKLLSLQDRLHLLKSKPVLERQQPQTENTKDLLIAGYKV